MTATSSDPLRVLLFDDERPALDELAWLLGRDTRVGDVLTTDSAAEALRVLQEEIVDAVFMDIRMPGLTGLEVAAAAAEASPAVEPTDSSVVIGQQLVTAGVPEQFATQFASGDAGSFNELTTVGDLGASILAGVPEQFRPVVEPLIPAIVEGINPFLATAKQKNAAARKRELGTTAWWRSGYGKLLPAGAVPDVPPDPVHVTESAALRPDDSLGATPRNQ